MRLVVLVVVVAGCGRIGFNLLGDGPGGDAPTPAIVRYPMDDDPTAGTIHATDSRFDGTCTGCPTATTGHLGGGYAFAGAQLVTLAAISSGLVGAAPYTCTMWAKATTNQNEPIISKPFSTTDVSDVFAIQTDSSDYLYFETVTPADVPDYLFAQAAVDVGVWHQYAVTWDGSTKRFYLDGATPTTETAEVLDANQPIVLGSDLDNGVPVGFFTGSLDELTFYDRALSDAEIAAAAAQ